jgi:putative heme-binding domain-containing protein
VLPSKVISDQYGAVSFLTTDGQVVTGRVANLNGDQIMVVTNMLDPGNMASVDRRKIEETKPSPVSMMPQGLLNTLDREEILDLVAYLLSKGDRTAETYR